MRRSSSVLVTKARSVRNMGKAPFKFKFDLVVEHVEKLAASGDVIVVWERSPTKIDTTQPATVNRKTCKADFKSERITAEMTLFKTHPSEPRFQEKVFKIAVRTNDSDKKTLGKIHLNLAEYAEVPSGSKRISAELSNGAVLIAGIQCTFLCMGKTADGKQGSIDGSDVSDESSPTSSMFSEDTPANFLRNKLRMSRGASKLIMRHRMGDNGAPAPSTDGMTMDKLRKENQRLRKQIEETNDRSAEIKELRLALEREPVYVDVVRELKETKMALAMLHLEKEKLAFRLMKCRCAHGSPTSR